MNPFRLGRKINQFKWKVFDSLIQIKSTLFKLGGGGREGLGGEQDYQNCTTAFPQTKHVWGEFYFKQGHNERTLINVQSVNGERLASKVCSSFCMRVLDGSDWITTVLDYVEMSTQEAGKEWKWKSDLFLYFQLWVFAAVAHTEMLPALKIAMSWIDLA